MAHMPKGEPRSVPDPLGDELDAVLRQESLRLQRLEQAARKPSSSDKEYLWRFHRPAFDRQSVRQDQISVLASQRAGASVLSPAELVEQQKAVQRVRYMQGNPMAGAAYGLASLMGASPRDRDRALMAGGLVDTALIGAAPLGASSRRQVAPPRTRAVGPVLDRKGFVYREPTNGGATGVFGRVTADMLGTGTRARRSQKPPGWQGHGTRFNEARGHLAGRQLGGQAELERNLVTLTHVGANTPQMSKFENEIARRVRAGEVIDYSANALYRNGAPPPEAVLLTAIGSRGAPSAKLVFNPAGRRR